MTRSLKILFLGIAIVLPTQAPSLEKSLKVSSFEMDPYISSEVETGYFREVVDAIFKEMGYRLSYEFFPYLRAPKVVENGTLEILAPAVQYEKNSATLVYSDPVLTSNFGDVTLSEKIPAPPKPSPAKDLIAEYLRPQLSTEMIVQQLDMLSAGRVDKIYLEKYLAAEVLAYKRPTLIQKFQFRTDSTQQLEFRIALSKRIPSAQDIIAQFNRTLARMRDNGSVGRILENQGYQDYADEAGTLKIAGVANASLELLKEMSPHFLAKHPHLKIQWNLAKEAILRERILRSLAFKSSGFDVITLLSYDSLIFASHGWIEPFTDLDKTWNAEDLFPYQKINYILNKQMVALPFNAEVSSTFYRKDLLSQKGLFIKQNPTFKETESLASALHQPAQQQYGICMLGKMSGGDNLSLFYSMMLSNGGAWLNAKFRPAFNTPPWLEALETYKRLLKTYGPPAAETLDAVSMQNLFAEGKCALLIDSSSSLLQFRDSSKSKVVGKFDLVDSPRMTAKGGSWYWLWSLAVSKAAKNKAIAKEFVAWATSEEFVRLVAQTKGWEFVPRGIRLSTENNPAFKKAEPYAKHVVDTIQGFKIPHTSGLPMTQKEVLLFFEVWPAIGKSFGRHIQAAFQGKITPAAALEHAQKHASRVMYQSGLYSRNFDGNAKESHKK